jgi:hypothetical protein
VGGSRWVEAPARAARDAEIEDLHDAVVAHHDVLGLDIAVDDAFPVRGGERSGGVREPADAHPERRVARLDRAPERAAGDELHDDIRRAIVLADVEDGDGVRVVEGRGRAGFAEQARAALRRGRALREDLERHAPAEADVVRAVDAAHPALADGVLDGVALERVAGLEHAPHSVKDFSGSMRGTTSAGHSAAEGR